MAKQKTNSEGKKIVSRIFLLLIVIVLSIYFIVNMIRLLMSPTDTYVVASGTLELSETIDAYIIRNEKVLQGNNYMNGMEKVIVEGKRVAKGDSVFRYYVNGEDTIKNEISELDKQISEAQKNESTIYTPDIAVLKEKIKELEERIYNSNSIEEIENYKKEIDEYTYKISTIVGEKSPEGSHLKELITQKENYLKQLSEGAEDIRTEYSGTVSYRIDNLEEIFTTEDFGYLNKKFLEDLNLKTGDLIETSNQKGKVITEFNSYLAMEMDSEKAMNCEVGNKAKIRYESDKSINAEIVYIHDEDNSRIIVFKVNDLPERFINYRKISVDVVWWEYTGLKVPDSAIIEENDKAYIERNRSGYNVKILVKILEKNDKYAIVDNYSTEELQEMGYSFDEIKNMYSIKQYDKIVVQGK